MEGGFWGLRFILVAGCGKFLLPAPLALGLQQLGLVRDCLARYDRGRRHANRHGLHLLTRPLPGLPGKLRSIGMAKVVDAIDRFNNSVRTLLILLLLIAFSTVSYYAWSVYNEKELQIAAKNKEIEQHVAKIGELENEIDLLALRLKLLKVDRRVARLSVLNQEQPEDAERVQSIIEFVELDQQGRELTDPQQFKIDGDMVYVNGKVVKFEDELVETNDPLRSASIFILQKIYGEHQKPIDGFTIDKEGERPEAYGLRDKPNAFEQKIWDNFWDIANDPQKAAEYGVRAANEESEGMRVRPGKKYEVEIRSSGGLSIKPLPEEKAT